MDTKTQKDISAADTSIGFDYQFYYFFYLILDLRHGEKIGLEVKDDVHVELPNGDLILIQTKHSVQNKKDGSTINITEKDKDLWKTLANWVKIINEQTDPIKFLNKTSFQLVTNKSNNKNPFFLKVNELQNGAITIKEFKAYAITLSNNIKDETIKGYVKTFNKLNQSTLKLFVEKMNFDLSEDNLIERIKKRLLEKFYRLERVEDVYNALHSSLRDKNYLEVKSGGSLEISFQDFINNFRHCFQVGLSSKLPIRRMPIILPSDLKKQLFIKQLIDIQALDESNEDEIIELSTQMLIMLNNLIQWEHDGDLGPTEKQQFQKNTVIIWKNEFTNNYKKIKRRLERGESIDDLEDDILEAAFECLYNLKKASLTIEDTRLDPDLSNGYFYLLTESKVIGWHIDWEKKYLL